MIDYTPLYRKEIQYKDLAAGLSRHDLKVEVHRLYDAVKQILLQCEDADIAFVPHDPHADDPYAEKEEHQHIGWTIGHLVAHITASNEESFVFSALLAQGIEQTGRIRTEADWTAIDTVGKAIQRLEESRRIILAYLEAWPDNPKLNTLRPMSERAAAYFGDLNAIGSALTGLAHHNEHIPQIQEVFQQSKMKHTKTV